MSVEEFLMSVATLNGHSPDPHHHARACTSCDYILFTPDKRYIWDPIVSTCTRSFKLDTKAFLALLEHIRQEWPTEEWK